MGGADQQEIASLGEKKGMRGAVRCAQPSVIDGTPHRGWCMHREGVIVQGGRDAQCACGVCCLCGVCGVCCLCACVGNKGIPAGCEGRQEP